MIICGTVPAENESLFAIKAMLYGIEQSVDVIDRDGDTLFVDVAGDGLKAWRAIYESGGKVHDAVPFVPREIKEYRRQ